MSCFKTRWNVSCGAQGAPGYSGELELINTQHLRQVVWLGGVLITMLQQGFGRVVEIDDIAFVIAQVGGLREAI